MKKWNILILSVVISCTSEQKQIDKPPVIPVIKDKIDCNYFWPARQVHVCIKEMPIEECEFLFSSGQFIREDLCYCDTAQREKNPIKTTQYIQYDCKH